MRAALRFVRLALLLLVVAGCGERAPAPAPLVVYVAASIAVPMRAVADSFTRRTGRPVQVESQASLELVRRVTELAQVPDLLVLADWRLFPSLLTPPVADHVRAYTLFATNRIVPAWRRDAPFADSITATTWRDWLTRPALRIGRADPATDPSGYRTLLVFQLAAREAGDPALADRLLAAAPTRYVRPREADQVALLEGGGLDIIWTYENLARQAGLAYLRLPGAVDLGTPGDSSTYRRAVVRVPGRTLRDSLTIVGEPIAYAAGVPTRARESAGGQALLAFLLGADGRAVASRLGLDMLPDARAR
ncbi:MAG: extracellular solute-binding protein [Gemmatimonadaceae bacterium]|jgi:molybdate/tungstate transport system substrate-binding protein|nr:extracellular solute-binding protein [Gemmatimonadaceae bacterium]